MSAHALRLISSDEDLQEPEPSGASLEDVWPEFEKFKQVRGRVRSTLVNYRTALNCLREWSNLRLSQPEVPAELLTLSELESFQEFVAGEDPTRTTMLRANHHLRQIKSIWDWAARRHKLPQPPLFPEPFEANHEADKTAFTDDQLVKLLAACKVAKWPVGRGVTAKVYWEGLLKFEAFYGFDVQSLVPYESDKAETALKLDAITFNSLSPCPYLEVHNEHGWAKLVRRKTKRKKPVPVYYPLNAITRAVVDQLWPPLYSRDDPPACQLFPWPLCGKKLRETWSAIVEEAGISPRNGGSFQMIHFRNTSANRYTSDVSTYMLGHSPRNHNTITEQHYRTALPKVVEEVNAAALAAWCNNQHQ